MDRRAKKAALFFLACDANPDTRVKIPDSMRIKGYSISEAADRLLQQQVRHEADKIKGDAVPGPSAPAAAASASALITLLIMANVGRPALRTITVPAAVSVLPAAGVAALPSPPRKTWKTLHQEQIVRQNERKQKAVNAQAHARATTLIAEERAKEKENRRTTAEVIVQVEGEFRARGFPVTMSKPTINRYVALNMIGTFPLARGYEGRCRMPRLSCYGSKTNAGSRPAVSFHDPHFPLTQRPAAKSSLSCTGIFGSNATGECVPIHWQLPTAATTKDCEKLRFDFLRHISSTRGRFGCEEERVWPCTIGMNEKGGMNDDEFDKYIDNSIVPLYPDLEDTQGK